MNDLLDSVIFKVTSNTAPWLAIMVSHMEVNQVLQTVSLVIGIVLGVMGIINKFRKL